MQREGNTGLVERVEERKREGRGWEASEWYAAVGSGQCSSRGRQR